MMRRLLRAWRPRIGWPAFVAVLIAALSFPSAVYVGHWVSDSEVLVGLGLLGGVLGTWLAGKSLRDRTLWALGFVVGGITAFAAIGEIVPSIALLFQAADVVQTRTIRPDLVGDLLRAGEWIGGIVWIYGREFVLRSAAFATQIVRWSQIALSEGTSRDNDIFLLLVGWLSWMLVFHAAAVFTRKRHPGLGLAPVGLAITTAVAAGRGGEAWQYVFLGLGTVLLAYGVYLRREQRWHRDGIDYSPEISLDVVLAGIVAASFAVSIAFLIAVGLPWATAILRKPLAEPTQQVGTTLDRLFGGVRRPPQSEIRWAEAKFTDLPLTRVLAGPPELRDDPVFRVTVSAPGEASIGPLYWRGLTYDRYTGRGWANSGREEVRRPPEPIQVAHLGPEITQQVELLNGAGTLRYAAPQPVRVDVGATWLTRDGNDLIGWRADAEAYTAVSRPTLASVEALRNAPAEYPDWVIERYLQLPADVPERVRERAQEIAGDAETAYDKAAAIESAMRAITYSLEVELPPPERDVVDHFLFDMDAGYCDYFATTMTVLARGVGVPARLATGYATGTYNPESGSYVVTGLNAHAWVEVYFPGVGWVPFEPTPARDAIERAPVPDTVVASDEARGGAGWTVDTLLELAWLPIGLLLVTAGAIGLMAWAIRRSQTDPHTAEDHVRSAYDAVWRLAQRFGWEGRTSQTPWEQIAALQRVLSQRSLELSLGGRQWSWRGTDVVEDLRRLGELYAQAQYSRQGVGPEEAQAAREAWHRIRWRLVLLWRQM